MKLDDIEVHVGDLDRPYRILGEVKATEKAATLFNNAPNVEGVNSKLREQAAKLGGNAVINVTYTRGMSLTSWKALTAKGIAVMAEAALVESPHVPLSVTEQLRELGDLRDRGILTEVEFDTKKAQLLARI